MSSLSERYSVASDPLRSERRVELAVVLLLVLLGLQLLWGVYSVIFPSAPGPVLPTAESLQVGQVTEYEPVTPEQRAEIRQRPVFWSSRRPTDAAAAGDAQQTAEEQEEKKPGKISGVKLSGVFGAGDSAGIIVLVEGKKRRVMVGEELKGWTLDSLTPVEAMFSNKGEQASLQLKRGKLSANQQSAPASGSGGKAGAQAAQTKKTKKTKKAPKKTPAPAIPDSLGLGGGDRNREKQSNSNE